ncbi:MAG: Resolvase, terminal domain, partial [Verrucomicrobiota bacterium]
MFAHFPLTRKARDSICWAVQEGIAYIRFSSEEQAEGHSIERQLDNVKAYCTRVDIKISETLVDEGLSAFRGTHISEGK